MVFVTLSMFRFWNDEETKNWLRVKVVKGNWNVFKVINTHLYNHVPIGEADCLNTVNIWLEIK